MFCNMRSQSVFILPGLKVYVQANVSVHVFSFLFSLTVCTVIGQLVMIIFNFLPCFHCTERQKYNTELLHTELKPLVSLFIVLKNESATVLRVDYLFCFKQNDCTVSGFPAFPKWGFAACLLYVVWLCCVFDFGKCFTIFWHFVDQQVNQWIRNVGSLQTNQ